MEIVAFTPIVQAFTEVSRTLGNDLLPIGKSLLLALGSVVISWQLVKSYLNDEGVNGMLAGLVEFCVIFGIPYWFLHEYNSLWGGKFVAGFDFIVSKLAGGTGLSDGVNDGIKMILGIGQKLFEEQPSDSPKNALEAIGRLGSSIAAGLFKVMIVAASIGIAAYFAVYMLFSQVLIGIALVIGPIFIPWLVLEQTSFIFNGWLRFIIIAGLYKVVGMLMLVYIAKIIPVMKTAAANSPYPNSIDVIQAVQVLIICGVMLMLAKQIPQIANGLLSGSLMAGTKFSRSKGGAKNPPDRTPPPPGGGGNTPPPQGGGGQTGRIGQATQALRTGFQKGGSSIRDRIQVRK